MQDGYAQITDITTGVDVRKAEDVLERLKTEAISKAQDVLFGNRDEFIAELKAGWSGAAVGYFIEAFNGMSDDLYQSLESMKTGITAQFTALTDTWVQHDQNVIGQDYY